MGAKRRSSELLQLAGGARGDKLSAFSIRHEAGYEYERERVIFVFRNYIGSIQGSIRDRRRSGGGEVAYPRGGKRRGTGEKATMAGIWRRHT